MRPFHLSSLGLANALGTGKAQVARGLFSGDTSGMRMEEGWIPGRAARVGRVAAALPPLPPAFAADDSSNNRLLLLALEEIRDDLERELSRHGRQRIAVVLGTSTSGMAAGEAAAIHLLASGSFPEGYHYRQQEIGRTAPFLSEYLGLQGPALTLSTACTSSGRALITARNLLEAGLCDAVITGGVDTLSRLTLNGFTALEACTPEPCNPMSRNRRGINIGEAAALFILRREESGIALLGAGESSDAHHISAPDPTGLGVETALRGALREAGLEGGEGLHGGGGLYLNLHATATPKNDEMEAAAVARVFPEGIPCSGTKPLTGHTLGASAATELAFCWLTLQEEWNPEHRLPPHVWDGEADPALPRLDLVEAGRCAEVRACVSASMAFGGNNLCLVVGR